MLISSLFGSRFGREVRATALLSLPLVLGHLSTGLINTVDNAIAGHHSPLTQASVTIGTAWLWLPMMVPVGTLISLTASISQLHGAGRYDEIGPMFRQALWLSLGLGAAMFVILTLIPSVLAPFGIKPEIIPGAQAFLHYVRWGVPGLTLYFCMRYLCEGMHWTLPTMILGFGGLCVLAPLGYLLTYGKLGLPEMGAAGLGLASAIMMWTQALAFLLYLIFSKRFAALGLFSRFEWPKFQPIWSLLKTGLPIGITILMEGGMFIVTVLLIGRMGTTLTSAHTIATSVAQLTFMIPMGIAEATTVRVGHAVGRGDPQGVRNAAWAGYGIVFATQICSAIVILIGHNWVVGIYTNDLAVAALASVLLLYAAAFQFPDGIQVVSAGALRGMKDTRVPMLLALISYWGVGMPLGTGLGIGLGWGPKGMWIGLIAGLTVAAVLMAGRFHISSGRLLRQQAPLTLDP